MFPQLNCVPGLWVPCPRSWRPGSRVLRTGVRGSSSRALGPSSWSLFQTTPKMSSFVSLNDLQMIPTCSQELFLKNDLNKAQFISILTRELRKEDHDIRNSICNTDNQLVSTALEYAADSDKDVVVVAIGTDILVLLMFHQVNIRNPIFSTTL